MYGMKRYSFVAIVLMSSISLTGQTIIKAEPPKNLKDTVYIGIVNKVKLEDNVTSPISAQSGNASVLISGNELVIRPTAPGELIVSINYKDTVVRRKFFSLYLPKPVR